MANEGLLPGEPLAPPCAGRACPAPAEARARRRKWRLVRPRARRPPPEVSPVSPPRLTESCKGGAPAGVPPAAAVPTPARAAARRGPQALAAWARPQRTAARGGAPLEAAPVAAPTSLEAALDAWGDVAAECQGEGFTLPPSALPLAAAAVAQRRLERERTAEDSPHRAPFEFGAPLFQHMLKAYDEQVHFMYFWRAFAAADCASRDHPRDEGALDEGGLSLELETIRDSVLDALEAECGGGGAPTISASHLVEAMRRTAAVSATAEFWRAGAERLDGAGVGVGVGWGPLGAGRLSLEEVTAVMLSWLCDAVAWKHRAPSCQAATPTAEALPPPAAAAEEEAERQRQQPQAEPRGGGLPVLIHVYDVSTEGSIHRMNKVLAHRHSPLKFGGAFHVGVEVNGLEWSFGFCNVESMSGISCVEPRTHPMHRFRQTVRLRPARLSAEGVAEVLSELIEEYPGNDYDLLRRNCCNFANDFCVRIGAGRIPSWITRLARLGARVDSALRRVTKQGLLSEDQESCGSDEWDP